MAKSMSNSKSSSCMPFQLELLYLATCNVESTNSNIYHDDWTHTDTDTDIDPYSQSHSLNIDMNITISACPSANKSKTDIDNDSDTQSQTVNVKADALRPTHTNDPSHGKKPHLISQSVVERIITLPSGGRVSGIILDEQMNSNKPLSSYLASLSDVLQVTVTDNPVSCSEFNQHASSVDEAIRLIEQKSTTASPHRIVLTTNNPTLFKSALDSGHVTRIFTLSFIVTEHQKILLSSSDLTNYKKVCIDSLPFGVQEYDGFKYILSVYKKTRELPFRVSMMTAVTSSLGIGYKGSLPWPYLKYDAEYYLSLTQETSIPGRKIVNLRGRLSHLSVSDVERNRGNVIDIVLSSNRDSEFVVTSLEEAILFCDKRSDIEHLWIMGGSRVYSEALSMPECETLYMTEICKDFPSDAFFPVHFKEVFEITSVGEFIKEGDIEYRFNVYSRKSLPDIVY